MTPASKILRRALMLAAVAAIAVPAAASASHGDRNGKTRVVGRIASISSTSVVVGGTRFDATARQLAMFSNGQCVEVELKGRAGNLRVVEIHAEDGCGPLHANANGGSDDPANHDIGDDHGRHGGSHD